MKKEKLFSVSRAKILSFLNKEPMTISQISQKTGMGRTTIYHHLNHLKKHGLITEKKEDKIQGRPVYITTNKASPLSSKMITFLEFLEGIGESK